MSSGVPGSGDRSGGGVRVWQCVQNDAERGEPQDTSPEEHEHSRQAAVVLLAAHHRRNHVARVAARETLVDDVHYRSQVRGRTIIGL